MASSPPPSPSARVPDSHTGNTGRSLRALSLLLLIVFFSASAALVHVALRQNAKAAEQSRFYVEKVLEARQALLQTTLADYAFWSAAYENLHVRFDSRWAYERRNMGSSLFETYGYEGVFLIGPDDITRYSVSEGRRVTVDVSDWAGQDFLPYIEQARQLGPDEEVYAGLIAIAGEPALMAAAVVGNDSDPTVPEIPGPASVIVWVDHLHAEKLQSLGAEFGIEALRLDTDSAHPASLGLTLLDGQQVRLEWNAPRPGDRLLQVLLPLLLLASLVLVVVTRLNLRNALATARAIDAGYQAAQAYQAQLTFHAQHDPLTGLPNRSLLHERLEQALKCTFDGQYLAVMLIDLDGFKPINDTYGHHHGDGVLVEVALRLSALATQPDTVARLGGDEFVVLMLSDAGREDLEARAEAILASLALPYVVEGEEFHITASAGLAASSPAQSSVQQLLQQADLAMYAAKAEGRNIYQWYGANLELRASEKLRLRNDLHAALENDELELYYQPQVCARTMRVLGIEALLRWQHPLRGMISPAEFIPLAEQTGQIIPISRWVLDAACRQLAELTGAGHHELTVAVNISGMHLMRRDFTRDVERALEANGVAAHRLELELTESVLLRQMDQAAATLEGLQALGVKIAIDDFGTGFSSLGYLRRLPVQRIKIDRSFIKELDSCPEDAAIAQGIIWLAHRLNMGVIAEGVETAAQAAFLGRHRCDEFQGYYFARPMPLASLQDFLTDAAAQRLPVGCTEMTPAE